MLHGMQHGLRKPRISGNMHTPVSNHHPRPCGQTRAGESETDMKATELIARSISHNEIAHGKWDAETAAELASLAEDSVENGAVIEDWGADDDGDEWRVHLYI